MQYDDNTLHSGLQRVRSIPRWKYKVVSTTLLVGVDSRVERECVPSSRGGGNWHVRWDGKAQRQRGSESESSVGGRVLVRTGQDVAETTMHRIRATQRHVHTDLLLTAGSDTAQHLRFTSPFDVQHCPGGRLQLLCK
uniref:Formamidopyrimidine-DNA glycosylase n=1 Tax=Lygus hesperus TaxID=30085 RepID=A0A0A9WWZ7_LYGHE